MMNRRNLLLASTLPLSQTLTLRAASDNWVFVWVSSGDSEYAVTKGRANVKFTGDRMTAEMVDSSGMIHYKLDARVTKDKVSARFTVVESDYFKDSPFSGTYQSEKWKLGNSKGRESIALTDGWNFIGICREIC